MTAVELGLWGLRGVLFCLGLDPSKAQGFVELTGTLLYSVLKGLLLSCQECCRGTFSSAALFLLQGRVHGNLKF